MKLKNTIKYVNQESPINSVLLDMIAACLVLTLILCVIINSALIYVFARYKKLRTALNKLILVMTALNLFGSIQFPFSNSQQSCSQVKDKYFSNFSLSRLNFYWKIFQIKDGFVHKSDACFVVSLFILLAACKSTWCRLYRTFATISWTESLMRNQSAIGPSWIQLWSVWR